jgi:hypothetical protein
MCNTEGKCIFCCDSVKKVLDTPLYMDNLHTSQFTWFASTNISLCNGKVLLLVCVCVCVCVYVGVCCNPQVPQ